MSAPTTSMAGLRALVCGASGGIGAATARAFAAAGADVVVLARSADALGTLAAELRAGGADAEVAVADLQDRAGLAATVDRLLASGPIHVLVNNTGGPPGGRLLDAEPEAFLAPFERHLLAAHLLVRALVPGMHAAGYGRILNVVSTSVYEPIPGLGVSNTIRAAVAGWAKSLSRELPPGITINNVLPGFTDTPRLASLGAARAAREGTDPDAVRAAWIAEVPEGRLAAPEETAATLAFLASPAAAYLRGQSIAVDGGRLRSI
jgi:3-oxoacyl-[acyl-carrier protein] reductase